MILTDRIMKTTLPNSVIQPENTPVPEFIDPVFAKTTPKRSFSVIENERFGLVFAKTGARNYRPCFRENQPKRLFSIK